MKIRQLLALRFTLVSALLTGLILILIYMMTRGFVHADFVERLAQHARLEALHYATPSVKEVIPSESYLLVNPVTSIYSEEGTLLYRKGTFEIPRSWITVLKEDALFNAEQDGYTTVGRTYDIDGKEYQVFVSDKDLPGQHELDILIKTTFFGWMASLVLSYLAGLYFSSNALQPMKHVVEEVRHITKDNLSYRLRFDKDISKVDEIDELILTFNALLSRIETAFISQKRFVQNASHELRTPLTAIMAEAELALARPRNAEDYKRTLKVVVAETERLVTITQGLLTLAYLEEGSSKAEMSNVDMPELIEKTLATFKLHHPEREVLTESDLGMTHIQGNAQLLQTALLNVLDNARKYSSDRIMLKVKKMPGRVVIGIRDFGRGIPATELNRVTSPLFRASNVRGIAGAGLGLSLVDRIVRVHAGDLEIKSEEGKGTYCEISLPLTQKEH